MQLTDKEDYWICARTRFNQEVFMKNLLVENGIQHFIPTCRKIQKIGVYVREVEKAVIPNLIFFKTSWSDAFALLTRCKGKINYIRLRDKKILTIPDTEMDSFIRLVAEMADTVTITTDCFTLGDRVIIKSGNLAGLEGMLTKIDGKNRFVVMLGSLLSASVRIPKSNLIKVKV